MMPATLDTAHIERAAMERGRPFLHALAPGKVRSLDHFAFDPSGALGHVGINYKTLTWEDSTTGDKGNGVIPWLARVRGMSHDDAARVIAAQLAPDGDVPAHVNGHVPAAPLAVVSSQVETKDSGGDADAIPAPADPIAVMQEALSNPIQVATPTEADKPKLSEAAEIAALAKLSPVEYDRARDDAAKRLGIRVGTLDDEVKKLRGDDDTKGQGRAPSIVEAEPWPDAVDLAETLDHATKIYERYLILPPGGAEKMALWAMLTHSFTSFPIVPRLLVTAATRECAKSLLLRVLKCTAARVVMMTNANIAPLFRSISTFRPSIFLDEFDNSMNENPELLALLNDGYAQGGVVWRCEGDNNQVKEFDVFAPVAIAMINRPRDTLLSRALVIRMERKKSGERTTNFRGDRPAADLGEIQRKFARAAIDYAAALRDADPDMGHLFNRDADNWRPLFAIADIAGGRWPKRVREIASADISAKIEESTGETLLADCRWIFDGGPMDVDGKPALTFDEATDRVRSADMVARLIGMEGRPWGALKNGKAITANWLAHRLGQFKIQTRTTRFDDRTFAKAYHRADFNDAFARYLATQSVTPSQSLCRSDCDASQGVTGAKDVTAFKASQPLCRSDCDGVTVPNGDSGDLAEVEEL